MFCILYIFKFLRDVSEKGGGEVSMFYSLLLTFPLEAQQV